MTDFLTNLAEMALGYTENKIKPISPLSEAEWLRASPIQHPPTFSNSQVELNQNLPPKEIIENNVDENDTQKKILEQENTRLSTNAREVTQTNSLPVENNLPNSRQAFNNKIYSKPTIELKTEENLNHQLKPVEVTKRYAFNQSTNLLNNKTILENDIKPNLNEKIKSIKLQEKNEIVPVAPVALFTNQIAETTVNQPTLNNIRLSDQVQKEDNSSRVKMSNAVNTEVFSEHEKTANNIAMKNSTVLADKNAITKSNEKNIDAISISQKTPITVINSLAHSKSKVKLLENMQPSSQLPLNDQKQKITLPKIKITIQRLHIRAPSKPKLINKKYSTPSSTISLIDYLNQSR